MAFSLDDDADMPVVDNEIPLPPQIESGEITAEVTEFGAELYVGACGFCHGKNAAARQGGSVPDLRYASEEVHLTWNGIVIGGSLRANGMPNFDLDPREADAIRLYVLSQSRALAESLNQR
jgi:mono/diheme cytochrome c family protein